MSEEHPEGEAADAGLVERVEAEGNEALAAEVAALREEKRALEAELAEAEDEIEELTERVQRKQAEFRNYKKRTERKREEMKERAAEDLVERIVDVRDNLARAVSEADEHGGEAVRDGVEATLSEFDRILDEENVSVIDPEPGTAVDPTRHEVMMRVESERENGEIEDVFRQGYEMGGKVLREAQVTVSDGE
jgi:molecular chaperone GrpE